MPPTTDTDNSYRDETTKILSYALACHCRAGEIVLCSRHAGEAWVHCARCIAWRDRVWRRLLLLITSSCRHHVGLWITTTAGRANGHQSRPLDFHESTNIHDRYAARRMSRQCRRCRSTAH
jgi:hypothetical protein